MVWVTFPSRLQQVPTLPRSDAPRRGRRGYIARQAIVNQPKTRPLQETAFSHKPRHANRC